MVYLEGNPFSKIILINNDIVFIIKFFFYSEVCIENIALWRVKQTIINFSIQEEYQRTENYSNYLHLLLQEILYRPPAIIEKVLFRVKFLIHSNKGPTYSN